MKNVVLITGIYLFMIFTVPTILHETTHIIQLNYYDIEITDIVLLGYSNNGEYITLGHIDSVCHDMECVKFMNEHEFIFELEAYTVTFYTCFMCFITYLYLLDFVSKDI